MKVKLEFDSVTDSEHVILLAVRAQDAYWLLDDLLDQLSQWIDENPSDQQGKAFERTRRWLCDEIFNRGLHVSQAKHAVCVDRAGNPIPRPDMPVAVEQHSQANKHA